MLDENLKIIISNLEREVEFINMGYYFLYNFENNGDIEKYNHTINNIKRLLKKEEEWLNILLEPENAEKFMDYLSQKYGLDISLTIDPFRPSDYLAKVRIINEMYIQLLKMVPKNLDESDPSSHLLYQLNTVLDFIRLNLSLLYKEGINELTIKTKYNLSFILPDLEQELIKTNFAIAENPYITRNFLLYNEELKKKGVKTTNDSMINLLRSCILELFSYKRSFEKDDMKNLRFKYNCTSMRATLVLMDEETSEYMMGKINEFLDGNGDYKVPNNEKFNPEFVIDFLDELVEKLENESDVRYTINIIKTLLEKIKQDREVPINISIGR